MYVCLGHGAALAREPLASSSEVGVPPATLETCVPEVRFEILIPTIKLLWASYCRPTPLRDDGLPLVLIAVVCLFGSWIGSDKGAT